MSSTFKENLNKRIDKNLVLADTEIKANKFFAFFNIILCAIDLIFIILISTGVYWLDKKTGVIVFAIVLVVQLILAIMTLVLKGKGSFIKYLMMVSLELSVAAVAIWNGYGFYLIFALPIILACQYYRTSFAIITAIITECLFALSIYLGAFVGVKTDWLDVNLIDLNGVTLYIGNSISNAAINSDTFSFSEYLKNTYLIVFLPESSILILLSIISIQGARHGRGMVLEESEVLAAKTKAEKEAADSRTQIMLSQIQPHFIYNTLNSIYYLCDKDPDTAKQAISEFSDYLRTNLNFMDKKAYVSFEQEMEHIKKYLSLEKMRFEDELKVEYNIECATFKVPALSIQPLVENAVKHGVCKRAGGGTVKVWSKDAYEYFEVGIEDDGVGFDVNKPFSDNRRHIGLENTKTRLVEMCKATVEINSEIGVGTKILIKLPKENYYEDSSSR